MRSRTAGRASDALMSSPSENAAERAAEDLSGDTAGRAAAERFCQVAGDLGADAARDAAGDDLARCKAPAARVVGAEDAANEGAEAAENAATGACWRRCLPAFGRRRSRRGVLDALLQNFLGRIGINRHVILAGDGAFRHRGPCAALLAIVNR
jgi:hypothetical protein